MIVVFYIQTFPYVVFHETRTRNGRMAGVGWTGECKVGRLGFEIRDFGLSSQVVALSRPPLQ